jgi:hypothetical protein
MDRVSGSERNASDGAHTRPYKAPRVVRLGARAVGSGDCTAPGSGEAGPCGSGNSASGVCSGTGASALDGCTTGNNAFVGCTDGNTIA